jgi:capsule polysaccharide export protein KpsC/LpsZ
VYVKEHPMQFTPSVYFRAQCGRTPDYYDDLVAIPNVRLVPMPMTSFDLTDHAQAVATVTGSVGWEAINRGKPVLLFGHPWYRGCEGTFQINSHQDCLDALDQIQTGYRINLQKLNMFVHAIEKVGIEGFVEPHLRIFDVTDQENAALIVRALQDFWTTRTSN